MELSNNPREFYQARIEQILESALPIQKPNYLSEAMRYSVLGGGKRIRAILVYATGEALEIKTETLDFSAAAIEILHAYSLVHDDLPCMDDDMLRRGKPTTHIAFDQATAVLAGDALQTSAFEILTKPIDGVCAENQLKILNILAIASGVNGMVKGQAIDLAAVGETISEPELEEMHLNKTGALIKASVLMASYCTDITNSVKADAQRIKLADYAMSIGLAFQVQDDILDIQSDTQTLGKQQGADIAAGKPTYPSIIGMDAAKKKLFNLHEKALTSLKEFGHEADLLREIADFIVKRIA
ncbi:MAG: geranylgeranyl pyrophosphate synthase [Cocleimonas sp.]|jgi:geranylgeranyl pyrophosphate synthase